MFKNTLLLFTLLLFSGCAERGYQLTTQANTHTLTAETSVDIGDTKIKTNQELHKMQEAIKKERKKKRKKASKAKDTITEVKAREKNLATVKKHKKETLQQKIALRNAQTLEKKRLALEKEEAISRKTRIQEEKRAEKKHQAEVKKLARLKAKEESEKTKILEISMAKQAEESALKKAKALQAEKLLQVQAALTAQKAIEAKKIALQKAEALRLSRIEEAKVLKEEQRAKAQRLKEQEKRDAQVNIQKRGKSTLTYTQPLQFQLINKIYHKFGSSEVHGHVIYLTHSGQETRLTGSKVYLLPVSAKLNNWYEKYYLKNKNNPINSSTVVNYLNSTYLNLEKNFEFYGVAEGSYYVIIVSDYPTHMLKNKKVYIAKKIHVGKNKKIMAVFSKKL